MIVIKNETNSCVKNMILRDENCLYQNYLNLTIFLMMDNEHQIHR